MIPITFMHANTSREVVVNKEMVFAIQYSAAHKCTHIISNAGAIIPVSESVEKAKFLIFGVSKYSSTESVEGNPVSEGTTLAKEANKDGTKRNKNR